MPEYRLDFDRAAQKEWAKLDVTIQQQFSKKLHERLCHRGAAAVLENAPGIFPTSPIHGVAYGLLHFPHPCGSQARLLQKSGIAVVL